MTQATSNVRRDYDELNIKIADYVCDKSINNSQVYQTAYYALLDSMACACLALSYPECTKLLGPIIPGTLVPNGSRVIGTEYVLNPVKAAFDIGTLIRWLDYNDCWYGQEWGHPSDNLGAILACSDYISRKNLAEGSKPLLMSDVLTAMIKAYEIQGILALDNSFNKIGMDHVILVKLASAAVITKLLGGDKNDVLAVLTQVWVDGQSLRLYRQAPNTGTRKSWAGGDATSRAVQLSFLTLQGEKGYSAVLSTPKWGFNDVFLKGGNLILNKEFDSFVMENILFKIAYPAEFHAQTAAEAAIKLHPHVVNKLAEIEKIEVETTFPAIGLISKEGKLHNAADRDHCLQYIVAVGLIFGELTAGHYEDNVAEDLWLEKLRGQMLVRENKEFTENYYNLDERAIANSVQVFFSDGSKTEKIIIKYPLGHVKRREEGNPLLEQKFLSSITGVFSERQCSNIEKLVADGSNFGNLSVSEFVGAFVK